MFPIMQSTLALYMLCTKGAGIANSNDMNGCFFVCEVHRMSILDFSFLYFIHHIGEYAFAHVLGQVM